MRVIYHDKLKSSVEGLVWPAAPAKPALMRLALLQQLDETQWWPPELLEQFQMQQLQELLTHASRTVPYYKELLKKSGWRHEEVITPELFRQLPVLTRDVVNQAGDMLNAGMVPEGHGQVVKTSTSGSTGNPVTVYKTGWSQVIWESITLRDHFWHQRDFSGSIAVIRHLTNGQGLAPEGLHAQDWGPPVSLLFTTGSAHVLDIRSKTTEQLDWLLRADPHYLLTFPSAAEAMVRLSVRLGRIPGNLREVRTIGETLSPETRNIINRNWGVPVIDCYSAQEIGYIALQAPGAEHYLVQAESVYVEILDEHDQPCKPGMPGRVVVTPIQNFATPLIRYAVGDYAEPGLPSACGRGLPVLNKILGRSRNMLVLPNGDRRFASIGIKKFNADNGEKIRMFQVIQKTPQDLLVKLVMHEQYSTATEAALKQHIQNWVQHPFQIQVVYVDDIPLGAGGKYEDFRCEVPNDQSH